MGKGENAGYQHFLLFPPCFEKASFPDTSKGVIVWEWVLKNTANEGIGNPIFHHRNKPAKQI